MRIRVLVFARLREVLGIGEIVLELPHGARVDDAWAALVARQAALDAERAPVRAALDGRLVAFDAPLSDGAEVAFLPPVGGG
jgi:molybdopterin converting factor small subunit